MGPNNIFPILHNNNAVQHSKRFLKNNSGLILPRWLKCPPFADNPDDEITGR